MFLVSDEVSITGASLKMLELRILVPAFHPEDFRLLYYPPLMSYLYLIFIVPVLFLKFIFSGTDFNLLKETIVLNPTPVWMVSRVVTAVLGTLTVYLTYTIGNRVFGKKLGLFASVFVAGSFFSVQLSHFARHWAPAGFFTYLIIAAAVLVYFKPERATYLWAGAVSGIAFGASYITGIGVVVFLLAHFLNKQSSLKEKFIGAKIWIFNLLFTFIGAIFTLLNYPEFHRIVFGEDSTFTNPKSFLGMLTAVGTSFFSFFQHEPVLVVAGVLGLIILGITQKRLFALFVSFPLIYWIILYFFFHFEPRYNLLLVPWFAVLGGLTMLQLWEIPFSNHLQKVVVIFILLLSFSVSIYYDYLLTKPDSREQAKEWIEENIPADSSIAIYTRTLELTPNPEAIEILKNNFPEAIRTKHQVLENISFNRYPVPAYNVLNFNDLSVVGFGIDQEKGAANNYDYLVVEYFNEDQIPVAVSAISEGSEIVKSFNKEKAVDINGNLEAPITDIFAIQNLGPKIFIYKLR